MPASFDDFVTKDWFAWNDRDYQKLERNTRNLTKALHHLSIDTIMSCDGHVDNKIVNSRDVLPPWPWVIVALTKGQQAVLQEKLDAWNYMYPEKKWILSEERIYEQQYPGEMQGMYGPYFPGCVIRSLVPENENPLLDATILRNLQGQAMALGGFLYL